MTVEGKIITQSDLVLNIERGKFITNEGNKKEKVFILHSNWENAIAKDCGKLFIYNEMLIATSKEVKWYKRTLKNKDKSNKF